MVWADSRKISRALRYSRIRYFFEKILSYGTFTPYGCSFQNIHIILSKKADYYSLHNALTTPILQRL